MSSTVMFKGLSVVGFMVGLCIVVQLSGLGVVARAFFF